MVMYGYILRVGGCYRKEYREDDVQGWIFSDR